MTVYIRDTRSPPPSSAAASRVMSRNRARNTSPEVTLRRSLWSRGVRGYRLHARGVPGRPDLVFRRANLAVFVNGCFWHGCEICKLPVPRSNTKFWREKFARNRARDARKLAELHAAGWRVITLWEHDLRDAFEPSVRKIEKALKKR